MHFRQLRGVFVGKMALAWSSLVRPLLAAIHILELLLELLRLNYPIPLLRALVHSLPRWPAAVLARKAFRVSIGCGTLSSSAMGKGDNRGSRQAGGQQDRDRNNQYKGQKQDQRGRERSPKHRHSSPARKPRRQASTSTSSSTSTQGRIKRRTKAAQKHLLRNDPLYQEYVKSREEAEQVRAFQKQGDLLASVLKKFSAARAPPIQHQQMPSQGVFTPEQLEQLRSLVSSMMPAVQHAGP